MQLSLNRASWKFSREDSTKLHILKDECQWNVGNFPIKREFLKKVYDMNKCALKQVREVRTQEHSGVSEGWSGRQDMAEHETGGKMSTFWNLEMDPWYPLRGKGIHFLLCALLHLWTPGSLAQNHPISLINNLFWNIQLLCLPYGF